MSTLITCPSCSRQLQVPEDLLGKHVRCPGCMTTFQATERLEAGGRRPEEEEPSTSPPTSGLPSPASFMSMELDHIDEPNTSQDREIPPPPEPPTPREVPPRYSWQQAGKEEPEPPMRRRWDAEEEEYERRRDRRERYVECPSCGYDVPEGATRCMRCGEHIDEEDFPPIQRSRRDCLPHRGGLILGLGIASLVLAATFVLGVVGLPLGIVAWVLGHGDLNKMSRNEMDPDGRSITQGGFICGIIGVFLNLFVLLSCGFMIWWVDHSYTPTPTRQRFNSPSSPSTPRF